MARTHQVKATHSNPVKGGKTPHPVVVENTLKEIEGKSEGNIPEVPAEEEKQHDERFLAVSMQTYVNAITSAAGFSRSALNLELAVGLSVFANAGKADIDTKKVLYQVYAEAGYKCLSINDEDYKTVNRRINTAAELFKYIGGKEAIDEMTVATSEMQSINVIAQHLQSEFDFKGINSVLAAVGKPVILKRDRGEKDVDSKTGESITSHAKIPEQAKPVEKPAGHKEETLSNEPMTNAVADLVGNGVTEIREARNRRAEDIKDAFVVKTEHLYLAIPPDVTGQELMQMATQLLELAQNAMLAEAA